MSDAAAAPQSEYGNANPWAIAILVSVATFMEVLDTTIANVALRYISGGLAVSSDEASWVITTYLVANSFWSALRCSRSVRCYVVSPGICRRCWFSVSCRDWRAAA
jgi:MFS family permease